MSKLLHAHYNEHDAANANDDAKAKAITRVFSEKS